MGLPKSTHPATQSITNTALVKCGITPLCITFSTRIVNLRVSSLPSLATRLLAPDFSDDPPFLEGDASKLNVGKSASQVLVNTARCEEREWRDWCTVNLCSLIFGPVEDMDVERLGVGSSKNFRQSSSSLPHFLSDSSSDSSSSMSS